jgi:hypothetical protein
LFNERFVAPPEHSVPLLRAPDIDYHSLEPRNRKERRHGRHD